MILALMISCFIANGWPIALMLRIQLARNTANRRLNVLGAYQMARDGALISDVAPTFQT
jgi:hypothetical protein